MLRGSTLAETLVMMLVAGIVFLATMEALTLVSRLVARRAAVLVEAGRQRDGIFRLGQLLTTADSIRSAEGGGTGELLYLYRAGGETTLTTRDSAAVFVAGEIIRKNMQAQCCKLLDLLCAAGVPLLAGVGMLREVIGFHPYRKSFDEIARRLERGDAFAETLARFPDLYDRKLTALVRVGEQTNRLPEMLRRQGETLTEELEYAIRRMGAMLEPALILLVGILVAVILIAMYMPMFSLGGIMG